MSRIRTILVAGMTVLATGGMVAGAEVVGVANASESGDDIVLIRARGTNDVLFQHYDTVYSKPFDDSASGRWIREVVADGRARFRNVESGQCMRYAVDGSVISMGDCNSEQAAWLVGTDAQIRTGSGAERSIHDTRVLNNILDAHAVEMKENDGGSWNIEKV